MDSKTILSISLLVFILGCGKNSDSIPNPSTNGKAGSMARFAINENTLYIVDNTSLKVFAISNAELPDSIGVTNIGVGI